MADITESVDGKKGDLEHKISVGATDSEKGQIARRFKDLYAALINGRDKEKEKVMKEYYKKRNTAKEFASSTTHCDSILHIAIYSRQKEIAREILKGGVDEEILTQKNDNENTILHETATTDMKDIADLIIEKVPDLLTKKNKDGETPLFRTASYGQTSMFLHLAKRLKEHKKEDIEMHLTRHDERTVLHAAVISQSFETACMIAKKYPELIPKKDHSGMTALQILSNIPSICKSWSDLDWMKKFIYNSYMLSPGLPTPTPSGNIHVSSKDINEDTDRSNIPKFSLVVRKWIKFIQGYSMIGEVWDKKKRHAFALRLAKLLITDDSSCRESLPEGEKKIYNLDITQDAKSAKRKKNNAKSSSKEETSDSSAKQEVETLDTSLLLAIKFGKIEIVKEILKQYPQAVEQEVETLDTSLLLAIKFGNIEIVKEILKQYPQAVEHESSTQQNILHIAVRYRRDEIFALVKNKEAAMPRMRKGIDTNGNTILHQLSIDIHNISDGNFPGPALQLQNELIWYERVKEVMLPHFLLHHNQDGKTAEKAFDDSHEKLREKSEEWVKRTSESCSLMAVLIATVAFTSAYTIPGGPNQSTGLPVLLNQPFFLVFTVMDVLSLSSSLTSVVMFLSILTSPFRLKDFRRSIPRKLILGFTCLFLSVTTMMLAFVATIILTVHLDQKKWGTVLVYTLAFAPVSIFALVQLPLYIKLLSK